MAVTFRLLSFIIITLSFELNLCVDAYSYIGCFQDATTDEERALPDSGQYLPRITIGSCRNFCAGQEFVYFGVEYDFCFCGAWDTDYSKHGELDEKSCNIPCRGNPSQMCGDRHALRVFVDNIPECQDIALENGQMHRLGLTATFSCIKGYNLQGNTQINCVYDDFRESFSWNGPPPICIEDVPTNTPRWMTTTKKATPTTYRTTQTTTKHRTTHTPTTFQSRSPQQISISPASTKDITTIKLREKVTTQPVHQQTTDSKKERETQAKDKEIVRKPTTQIKQDIKEIGNGTETQSSSHYSLILIVISLLGLIMGVI
ncbi:hypothetical protein HOLleu_23428 [Holothuria leucospilota]|uniref:Uncharacterized protein n=1 Tax=Holothuria leucospilota TaxID=206669 RepID=A0A9Q1BUZ6_HOLLE|nr:hypothetical protein HOLleu_23428 [Holothuria leucospilota]